MKTINNLWNELVSMDNLIDAYKQARKGKAHKKQVMDFDNGNPMEKLKELQQTLINGEYKSGQYRAFTIYENKERTVYDIDFYPHRIVHWAIINVTRKYLMDAIGNHSFSAMRGRGSHQALMKLREYLHKDPEYTQYCFKMDVKKFFPSIDKEILMGKLQRRFREKKILNLFKEIIYGYEGPGLPIGNYTSQYLANFYLAEIDRHFKQNMRCKYYLRYMDDIIILGKTKRWLWKIKRQMDVKLKENKLTMKGNWQIFPTESRGVDFVGYRSFRNYTLLRKRVKNKLKFRIKSITPTAITNHDKGVIASYSGILGWCDGFRLKQKTFFNINKVGAL